MKLIYVLFGIASIGFLWFTTLDSQRTTQMAINAALDETKEAASEAIQATVRAIDSATESVPIAVEKVINEQPTVKIDDQLDYTARTTETDWGTEVKLSDRESEIQGYLSKIIDDSATDSITLSETITIVTFGQEVLLSELEEPSAELEPSIKLKTLDELVELPGLESVELSMDIIEPTNSDESRIEITSRAKDSIRENLTIDKADIDMESIGDTSFNVQPETNK